MIIDMLDKIKWKGSSQCLKENVMVHITESFLKEVELLKLINKSHRDMHWEIVPKELEYSDWGDELYANSYELMLTDDRFGQEKSNELNIQELSGDDYNVCRIVYDLEYEYVKAHHPEIEIDDETELEDYMPEDEVVIVRAMAQMIVYRNIASYAAKMARQDSDVNKTIRIYAGNKLLITDNPEESGEEQYVPDKERVRCALESMYFFIPSAAMIDLRDTINGKDTSHMSHNRWLKNLLYLAECKVKDC